MPPRKSPRAKAATQPKFQGPLQPHSPRKTVEFVTPGPGDYAATESVGAQPSSRRPTSSKFSFGKSSRGDYTKQFITRELQAHMPTSTTKGVEFVEVPSLGKQADSRKKTVPSFSFGKSGRDSYHKTYLNKEHQSKMPGRTTTGVDYLPTEHLSTLGKNPDSRKRSSPRFGFGSSPRSTYEKQYINREQQAKMPSSTTAKVDFYTSESIGKQVSSTTRSAPSFGFGTTPRMKPVHLMKKK